MEFIENIKRDEKAKELLQSVRNVFFPESVCSAHILYDTHFQPIEFYGKIYKKEIFFRKSTLIPWLYIPYIKETRFMEIKLTHPKTFSGFSMKFSDLVKSEVSHKINQIYIEHKFWINCGFQYR